MTPQTEKSEPLRCHYCGGDQFHDVHSEQASWWARMVGWGRHADGRLVATCLLCNAIWYFPQNTVRLVGYANTVNRFTMTVRE